MHLITSYSAAAVTGQRLISLPVSGIPDNSKVSGFWLECVVTNAVRPAGTILSPAELSQMVTLWSHTPGNSKYGIQLSGHRLSYNRYFAGSKRVGNGISNVDTGFTFDLWVPTSPLQGIGSINKGARPFGSELNGSTIQVTFDPANAAFGGVGGQFSTLDVQFNLYCSHRDSLPGEESLDTRLFAFDSDDFVGNVLSLADGSCTLLAIESRAYSTVSVNVGGYSCSVANSPYATDLASQLYQLSTEAGGSTWSTVVDLAASDVYLAQYPKQVEGAISSIGISRVFDMRNHSDVPLGATQMTITGRPASTAIGYLCHYMR